MSTTFFLYRRNGTYYFRWHIPLCCRVKMPANTPNDLRLSLHTTSPIKARYLVARYWLAAIETVEHFLATHSSIRYHELVEAIKIRARMTDNLVVATGNGLITLGEVAGTVELVAVKDVLAKLNNLSTVFYIPISSPATVWSANHVSEENIEHEIIETIDCFTDASAILTSTSIVDALASEHDLLNVQTVKSNQFGCWSGTTQQKKYHEVLLDSPVRINISSILVESRLVNQLPPHLLLSNPSMESNPNDCTPLQLTIGLEAWLKDHADLWSSATKTSYKSYVVQFIDIVGDKLTTNLKPADFERFDAIMRKLPKNWVAIRAKTKKTHQVIADEAEKLNQPKLDSTSLKERGQRIGLFFNYLKGKGYWHGKYGNALFTGIKKNTTKTHKHVFSDKELQNIFQGDGIKIFETAKFALYVWGTVLMLYTGARPSEISQLQRKDILQDDDDVWYFYINEDDDDGKKLKTTASKRSVPIHPILFDLGFMKYIKPFKSDQFIFPEYKRHKQKPSREIGDWVNGNLLRGTVAKEHKSSQYSFRHTVIERFKANATMDHYSCAYTGHSTSDDKKPSNKTFVETYGRGHKPKTLADNLHPLLNYQIDWAPLKKIITDLDKNWKGQRILLEKKEKIAKKAATAKTSTK